MNTGALMSWAAQGLVPALVMFWVVLALYRKRRPELAGLSLGQKALAASLTWIFSVGLRVFALEYNDIEAMIDPQGIWAIFVYILNPMGAAYMALQISLHQLQERNAEQDGAAPDA